MDEQGVEVRAAFERHLETQGLTLSDLTLGSAFKTMLGFHAETRFAWAERRWDMIHLEWDEQRGAANQSGGFLGLFRKDSPGQVTGYSVTVRRSLEAVGAVDGEDFVYLSIVLHYSPTASLETALIASRDERLDTSDAVSMEAFVRYVLKLDYFIATALETPSRVELMLET